jgi:hypothetical protein
MLTTGSVKENMTILCKKFFPNELADLQNNLIDGDFGSNMRLRCSVRSVEDWEAEKQEPDETHDQSQSTISGAALAL